MAKIEKLRADIKMFKAFNTLKATTKKALEKGYRAVNGSDDGSEDMDNA